MISIPLPILSPAARPSLRKAFGPASFWIGICAALAILFSAQLGVVDATSRNLSDAL